MSVLKTCPYQIASPLSDVLKYILHLIAGKFVSVLFRGGTVLKKCDFFSHTYVSVNVTSCVHD